eukprot:XP_001705885.1 Hypothetical protein GL50803_93710 [Giardia lamblia ATCC 50803]
MFWWPIYPLNSGPDRQHRSSYRLVLGRFCLQYLAEKSASGAVPEDVDSPFDAQLLPLLLLKVQRSDGLCSEGLHSAAEVWFGE